MHGLLHRPACLRQPFVVGRATEALGGGLTKLIEGDLVEVVDDRLKTIGEIVVPTARHSASATRSMGCLTFTPAAARW